MKTENLVRGLKLLATECNGREWLEQELNQLRDRLIYEDVIKKQTRNIEMCRENLWASLAFKDLNNPKYLIEFYVKEFQVSYWVAQHCINYITGVKHGR